MEIEAEMSRVDVSEPPRNTPKGLTLEEVEQQMMAALEPPRVPALQVPPPPREATPVQMTALADSGYASQQALLDSMFPELGSVRGETTAPLQLGESRPTDEDIERREAMQQRITDKIAAMSRYNNLMGSSDKDFITRIQLSQLASADPYASDFYAQVFSARLKRSRMAGINGGEGPSVVQVAPGFGLGAAGPAGNRFGKMGSNTMQKLSTQVKKLVENRTQHQKGMGPGELARIAGAKDPKQWQLHCKGPLAASVEAMSRPLDQSSPFQPGTSRNIGRSTSLTSRPVPDGKL